MEDKPVRVKVGGRKKGTPNKITGDVRQAIADAADQLGGTQRLVDWAREDPANEKLFWSSIWVRIVPKDINTHIDGKISLEQLISNVDTD